MDFYNFLLEVENPQIYTGREINVVKKPFDGKSVNICLVFPDTYEIGMSHLGIKILYHNLNEIPGVNAERCFVPKKDSIQTFKNHRLDLFSIENRVPLKHFDLISFSLLSEMGFTNLLLALDLSNIPLQNSARGEDHPIVAAGGISAINPEPLRDYVDFFGFGDGESLFPDIVSKLKQAKRKKWPREDILCEIGELEGVYVPSHYGTNKKGSFYIPELKGIKGSKIKKRVVQSIEKSFPHEKIIVPIGNVVFDRLDVELGRGCPQRCRFCQAQSYYAPYRVSPPQETVRFVKKALESTGFETVSLSSLSSGDYPHIGQLLRVLPDIVSQCTALSVSSLRPSTLSDQLLATIAQFRKTGITIVPEAGSQRLRNILNKHVNQSEILTAVQTALDNQWQKIKLYFMIGLPTETEKDITDIVDLLKEILRITKLKGKSIQLHVSFSSFVPKPHTPLQWAGREALESTKQKIHFLKKELKRFRNLRFDFHPPERSIVETIIARGDSRVGDLLFRAYQAGEIFSAWDSHFNFHSWLPLIEHLDLGLFLEPIPLTQPLPWDFIEVNYNSGYLKEEYKRAMTGAKTPSCWDQECRDCRGCGLPWRSPKEPQTDPEDELPPSKKDPIPDHFHRVRIFYKKDGDYRCFSHLSMIKYIERIIRKTGIKFKCTEGFHPRLKASHLPPLPVHATGCEEIVEMHLDANLNAEEIFSSLKSHAEGVEFFKVEICNDRPPLSKDIHYIVYSMKVTEAISSETKIAHLLAPTDSGIAQKNRLIIKIDFRNNGMARFGKIYNILDPDRHHTHNLRRDRVIFKHDIPD